MEDDLQKPLRDLTSPQQSLVSTLLDIQKHQIDTPRSFTWAQTFTCLFTSSDRRAAGSVVDAPTHLHRKRVQISDGDYIAVSWRWNTTSSRGSQKSGYLISPGFGHKTQRAQVSNAVMDRIVRYAHHVQVPAFWIDKECIDQKQVSTKTDAIQVMDLVYRCSRHPIAILTTSIQSQADLDMLLRIVSGRLLSTRPGKPPRLARGLTSKELQSVINFLVRLTNDPWWTRRWTFQEEYCSYRDMKLLIPHRLDSFKKRRHDDYEVIKGEVVVRVAVFREQVTRFCLACAISRPANTRSVQAKIGQIRSRAESYTISHKYDHESWTTRPTRTLSTRILADVAIRGAEKAEDLPAIMANCCGYSVRLDTEKLVRAGQDSLSLNLLALSLLNGELMHSGSKPSLENAVPELMGRLAFSEFDLPVDQQELTFMKQCRLPDVQLRKEGVRTRGYIWEKHGTISTKNFAYTRSTNAYHDTLSTICMSWLSEQLEKCSFPKLASDIRYYLIDDDDVLPANMRGQRLSVVFDQTISCLINAIEEQQNLIAARLVGDPAQWGIFVESGHSHTQSRFMFTASEAARFSSLVEQHRNPAKYVSLEVDTDQASDGNLGSLRIRRWMNGVTFPGHVPPKECVFEWPEVLQRVVTSPCATQSSTS